MTELTQDKQTQVIDAKNLLANKEQVLMQIGQLTAFDFINKLATVANLKILQEIKDRKDYLGLTYEKEDGELATVANWEEFCKYKLGESRRTIDDRLLNLKTYGEDFYDKSQKLSLGSRELRKLRNLDQEKQALVINSEQVDLGDADAVKDLIEELTEQYAREKSELSEQLTEATRTAEARKKVNEGHQAELEKAHKKIDQLERSQAPQSFNWKKTTREINLECTKIAAEVMEGLDKLLALNERIVTEEMDGEHSELALQQLAEVQVHCVDQVFVACNTLSIETRDCFAQHISNSHPMYSEDELDALVSDIIKRG